LLADFLGSNDEVHIFREVTQHLNISCLDCDFNGMGQHPYHPLMLLRLLMWGMANRVVSYIYLAGNQRPDYCTLARFRCRNAKKIEKLFNETVLLCARLGMVNLGHIALDGTKLKASTSKHKAMSYGQMKQEEENLEKEIVKLTGEAEDNTFGKDNNGYIYLRKWVAEQAIGQIKEGMGFRGVTMRGELFACAQWLFTCAVHNVMKAMRFIADLGKLKTTEVLVGAT
jgi:transposase